MVVFYSCLLYRASLFIFFSLCGDTIICFYIAPGPVGEGLDDWRDFKSLQPWNDLGYLQTFKRTVIYCAEKGMLLKFEQWNMFCSRWLQTVDCHSICGGKALTICYYILNNYYFRKSTSVYNAFEMSLPVLHLPYELWYWYFLSKWTIQQLQYSHNLKRHQ